jgi:hypothetical protein
MHSSTRCLCVGRPICCPGSSHTSLKVQLQFPALGAAWLSLGEGIPFPFLCCPRLLTCHAVSTWLVS